MSQNHNAMGEISAPTVALALKWCRDEKGAIYIIAFSSEEALFCCEIQGAEKRGIKFYSYEIAESAMLDELLDLLEKQITK